MKEEKRRTRRKRRPRPERKKGRVLNTIILVIALVVFCFSAFQLYTIFSEYSEGSKEYAKVLEIATNKSEKAEEFTVDFNALKAINPDTIAWIRFEEPAIISYPIVKSKDNNEYLTRTFEANDNKLGTLFVDKDNSSDFTDSNTLIYGHNMKNGSMFAKLLEYKKKEFYDQYPYFYIYTPDGKRAKYQIFSAGIVDETAESFQTVFGSPEEFQRYLDVVTNSSGYNTGVSVSSDSKVVSLSTCTNVVDTDRFLVHGVKISEE